MSNSIDLNATYFLDEVKAPPRSLVDLATEIRIVEKAMFFCSVMGRFDLYDSVRENMTKYGIDAMMRLEVTA